MVDTHGVRTVKVTGRYITGSLDGPTDPDIEPDATPLVGLQIHLSATPVVNELQMTNPPTTMIIEAFDLVTNTNGELENPDTGAFEIRIPADYPSLGGGVTRIKWKSEVRTVAGGKPIITKGWVVPLDATEVDLTTIEPLPGSMVINLDAWEELVETAQAARLDATAAATSAGVSAAAALQSEQDAEAARDEAAAIAAISAPRNVGAEPFVAKLDTKAGQAVFGVLSDSTGGNSFGWPTIFASWLASENPSARVRLTDWDDGAQAYPPLTVVQEGTAGASSSAVEGVADNFNRAAADLVGTTGQIGGVWQGTAGRFSLDGSKMVVDAAGLAHAYGAQVGDHKVTVTGLTVPTASTGEAYSFEVGLKATDPSNRLFVSVYISATGNRTLLIYQTIAGTSEELTSSAVPISGSGSVVTGDITVALVGDQITATYAGATATATVPGPTLTALAGGTGVILWPKSAGIAGATVDAVSLSVEKLDASIADDFNRAAADLVGTTGQTGGVWQGTAGRISTNGTEAVVGSAGVAYTYGNETGDPAATVTDLTIPATAGQAYSFEVGVKATTTENRLFVSAYVTESGNKSVRLYQTLASVSTALAAGVPIAGSLSGTLTLALVGNQLTATYAGATTTATVPPETLAALADGNGLVLWPKSAGIAGATIGGVSVTVAGSESGPYQIDLYNGTRPGSRLDYHLARIPEMLPETPDVVVINSSHNYGIRPLVEYITDVRDAVNAVLTLHPNAGIVLTSQNPEFADGGVATPAWVRAHAERNQWLRVEATRRGLGYVPAFEAFTAKPGGGRAWVQTGGIHPKYDPTGAEDGNLLWRETLSKYLASLSQTPA